MPPAKPSPLLAYLIMLLGVVTGYFYNSQTDPATYVTPLNPELQVVSVQELDGLTIDYALLESEQFMQLRVIGELPVNPGSGGKENPFQ
jgi:hypothetical protein